ncbi:AI-2E family transporter [Leucobacter sp. W1153]|uniref:AI-2E family transporter n=1 Tax=Leucobacter sp. W1153 TaxID=3439064 RepID=UPI003F3A21AA
MEEQSRPVSAETELPLGVRVAAAWSWRLILIGAAIAALLWLIVQVRVLVVPVMVAILLTALLQPIVNAFVKRGLPRSAGVGAALLAFLLAVGALVWLIVSQLRGGFGDVARRSAVAWNDFLKWIESAPFGLTAEQVNGFIGQLVNTIETHQDEIWTGALAVTTTAGQLVAGSLLALFSLIFLLLDGKRIWFWVLGFLPSGAHAPVHSAGLAGWTSVGQYVRVQIFVAFVDAVGIGLGALILGVPLPIPIAILVFLGSFIPFLGAISTGLLAAFIALVYNGPVNALLMLGVVILVNQIEGHVLQPLVMGSAVKVHPLGVVLAVSGGALLAGIPGALFAVPLAASASAIVNTLMSRRWDPDDTPVASFLTQDKRSRQVKHRARNVARITRKEGRV